MTWRISLLIALMAVFAMIYQIPESAIGCYLIIFLMKEDANANVVIAIAVTILLSFAVALIFVLTNLTINSIFLRVLAIFGCSYFFVYLGARSNVTEIGNLLALVICFLLTLLSNAPSGELATRAILYALLMASSPMGLMLIFNLLLGKQSKQLLVEKFSNRIRNAENRLNNQLIDLLDDQSADCELSLKLMKLFHLQSKAKRESFEQANKLSLKIIGLVSILPASTSAESKKGLNDYLQMIMEILNHRSLNKIFNSVQPLHSQLPTQKIIELLKNPQQNYDFNDNVVICELAKTLRELLYFVCDINSIKLNLENDFFKKNLNEKTDVHQADIITTKKKKKSTAKNQSPDIQKKQIQSAHYFAIKVTLAAVISYGTYTLFDWQGIHTAMITCYVVALGTTAETVHKLLLRIIGCLFGALLGVLSVVYIIPNLDSAAGLFLLIFFGMLIPSWITAGTEMFSYAGVQVGLAFLLTTLDGFSPTTDLSPAQDRILGILLGNVVCFVIFTRLWPVSLSEGINKNIKKMFSSLLRSITDKKNDRLDIKQFSIFLQDANKITDNLQLIIFDENENKLSQKQVEEIQTMITKMTKLNTLLLLPANKKTAAYYSEMESYLNQQCMNEQKSVNIGQINNLLDKHISELLSVI